MEVTLSVEYNNTIDHQRIPIRRWGVSHSRLDNAPGVHCFHFQNKMLPKEGGTYHVQGSTTRRAPFAVGNLVFTDQQHDGLPLLRGVSRSQIYNATGICINKHLNIKILLFIHFISYIFYNIVPDLFVLMICIVYLITLFVHENIPIFITVYSYSRYSYS